MNATEQRTLALKQANAIRYRRADEKRRLKSLNGSSGVAAADLLIHDPAGVPDWLETLTVSEFLLWVRGVGPRKRTVMLRDLGLGHGIKLGVLSEDTRHRLADLLR